ncbi:hypothetical protein CCH79_00019458 [Gambusia affinis]|uniref:Uncharacterized protein n=1 Tax=Gambusia affinis TaxID=33528 RepID=A0A315VDC8_GAMAF|nr:hypothetical protein CCH79_00019458 [Gambusia affinis]
MTLLSQLIPFSFTQMLPPPLLLVAFFFRDDGLPKLVLLFFLPLSHPLFTKSSPSLQLAACGISSENVSALPRCATSKPLTKANLHPTTHNFIITAHHVPCYSITIADYLSCSKFQVFCCLCPSAGIHLTPILPFEDLLLH